MVEAAHRDPEILNSQGLAGHSLVQFWQERWRVDKLSSRIKRKIDPDKFYIIGCDEEVTTKLSLYRKHLAGQKPKPKGVIDRVFKNRIPEMSPDISYYSEDEYPHRDFALSCGIRASFCFPLYTKYYPSVSGVLEIVSTCNQDIGTLGKFCESFKEYDWEFGFQNIHFQEYAISELDDLLEVACQRFQLPLAQYCTADDESLDFVRQFTCRDYKNLAPWCQFRDACLHHTENPLGYLCESREAFFCRDITALSITKYYLAHYARSCGSVACFTIYFWINYPRDAEYVLEFFLPSQKMDNDHTQSSLNSIWEIMKPFLRNCELGSGKHLGEVLSVKVKNSSTQTESESFEIGQHQTSVPHHVAAEIGTMISIPQQEFRKETMVSEYSAGKFLSLEDNTTTHFVNKTSTEAHTSNRERKSEEDISFESISKHFGRPLDDAAKSFGVSRSTFKRICRHNGIGRWERKLKNEEPSRGNLSYSGVTPVQDTVFAGTGQDLNKMTVKVTYNGINIRFKVPGLSGIAELENNVIERLHLERDSFSIKYQDDEGDWVLIACDKDVWECMEVSRSLKKTTIKLLLDQPIHHHAP